MNTARASVNVSLFYALLSALCFPEAYLFFNSLVLELICIECVL